MGEATSSCSVNLGVLREILRFDCCDDIAEIPVLDMESTSRSAERCISSLETVSWLPIDDVTIGMVRCERCACSVLYGV